MRRTAITWISASFVAVVAAIAAAQDYVQDYNEEKVDLAQVPAPVRAAAEAAAKGVRFDRAFLTNEKRYRLVGTKDGGALVVVEAAQAGEVQSVTNRTRIDTKDVPGAVARAFDAERKKNKELKGYKTGTVERAEIVRGGKTEPTRVYQFRGRNAADRRVEVDVREDGSVASAGVLLVHPDANRKERTLDDVPAAVEMALREGLPGVRVLEAVEQTSPGSAPGYLVKGKDASGRRVSADVTPTGTVLTVRFDLSPREVPEEAVAALRERVMSDPDLAGFRTRRSQRLELRQLGALVFVFLGKNGKGTAYEVRVPADGSNVTVATASDKDLADAPRGADDSSDDAKPKAKSRAGGRKGGRGRKPR